MPDDIGDRLLAQAWPSKPRTKVNYGDYNRQDLIDENARLRELVDTAYGVMTALCDLRVAFIQPVEEALHDWASIQKELLG